MQQGLAGVRKLFRTLFNATADSDEVRSTPDSILSGGEAEDFVQPCIAAEMGTKMTDIATTVTRVFIPINSIQA